MLQDMFKVRRRFAIAAFALIGITLLSALAIAAFGEQGTAQNLREAGVIISPIIICLTGVIAQYAHLVFKQDNAVLNKA